MTEVKHQTFTVALCLTLLGCTDFAELHATRVDFFSFFQYPILFVYSVPFGDANSLYSSTCFLSDITSLFAPVVWLDYLGHFLYLSPAR